jgi:DnaJ-class molecular chaperone
MEEKEYYKILELPKNADINMIKNSYKKMALKYHPDRNYNNKEESEKKFKLISEAYQVLSCKEKKIIYDSCRNYNFDLRNPDLVFQNFFKNIPSEYMEESHKIFNLFLNSDKKEFPILLLNKLHNNPYFKELLSDILDKIPSNLKSLFSILLNKNTRTDNTNNADSNKTKMKKSDNLNKNKENIVTIRNRPNTMGNIFNTGKNDIYINVNISLEDIYNKVEKEVKVQRIRKKNNWFREEEISLSFPAHFQPALKFKNEGNQFDNNIESGNIIININSKPHKNFKRKNEYDLLLERYISIYEIYNGTHFTVKYLNNKFLSIRSKKCIYQNMLQKVPDLGLPIPDSKGKCGDLYIQFKIQFPSINIEEQDNLLFKLFPPVNNGIPDAFYMEPFREVLLDDS